MRRWLAAALTIVFSFLVPGAVGGWIPWLLPHAPVPPPPAWWPGLLLVAAGGALYAWCAAEFVRGLGTPFPLAETETLVVRGPYRVVRNPMYLAVLCAILGWAVFLRSAWVLGYAALFALAVTLFVAVIEEPRLQRRFGASYSEYRSRVRPWRPRWPRRAGRRS